MKNVLLVFGGESYEHDISIVTASQIYNKTKIDDVKLIPLYMTKTSEFYIYESKSFNLKDFTDSELNLKKFKKVVFLSSEKCKIFLKTRFGLKEYIFVEDAIFACHGGVGENGELVAFFNRFGIGTSAGNALSLSLSMDKFLFKQVMRGLKIPVVSGFKVTKRDYLDSFENLKYRIRFLKFPMIIKINSGGSSIGLFVAKNRIEFYEMLNTAFEFDDEVLVEEFISDTREFNVAVIGENSRFEISEIDEPLKNTKILSFNSKKGGYKISQKNSMAESLRKFPAQVPDDLRLKIKKIAAKIFKELNFSGVVRIDFLYQKKTGKLFVCEVNAIPGSLAYYFFEENRISTNDLVRKLIKISEHNRQAIKHVKKEFLTNILK